MEPLKIDIKEISMEEEAYQQERLLRNEVLLKPHGIAEFGWEQFDPDCHHIVAAIDQKVVGCVLLRPHTEGPLKAGQLLQMAVSLDMQRQGIGYLLIERLIARARYLKLNYIHCHSRIDAVEFYRQNGFECYAEPFWEVGIEHRHMKRIVK